MSTLKYLAAAAVLAVATAANGALLEESFESYPLGTSAALDAKWAPTGGTIPVVAGTGTNTSQVLLVDSTVVGRRTATFADTVPTPENPLAFSFDLYDAGGNTATTRQYGEILANTSGGSLAQLIAVGRINQATGGIPTPGGTASSYNSSKYHARVAFGTGGGYINLQTARSVGWHNFKVVLDGTKIDFYVDGVYDSSFTNGAASTGATAGYDTVRLGANLSTGGSLAYYDNVLVAVVPEPASLSLVGLGALGLLARRRQ